MPLVVESRAQSSSSALEILVSDEPSPVRWLSRLFGDDAALTPGVTRSTDDGQVALLVRSIRGAAALDDRAFEAAVRELYLELLGELRERGLEPIRLWNHVPEILRPGGRGGLRYMVFNAGRYAAYAEFHGAGEPFGRRLPTASGTGCGGSDLLIYCLAPADGAETLENARQIPAYRYSKRYGTFPPCFTRATRVASRTLGLPGPERPALLVGGTASIRGESSLHRGLLMRQLEETLDNLVELTRSGLEQTPAAAAEIDGRSRALGRFRDLRVYHPSRADRQSLRDAVGELFPGLDTLELVTCDLCRPELLVEIEGTAV